MAARPKIPTTTPTAMATVFGGSLFGAGGGVGEAVAEATAAAVDDDDRAADVDVGVAELLLDTGGSKKSTGFLVLPVSTTHRAPFPPPGEISTVSSHKGWVVRSTYSQMCHLQHR